MKNRTYFFTAATALLMLFCLLMAESQANAESLMPADFPVSASKEKTSSPLADTTSLTICNNQLPYDWNGRALLSSGVYSAVITGSNGQDSLVYLNLHVIDVGTSITNAVICNNQLPYRWNGLSITASGTYSVTLTSANGCDSVPILSLTVNNVVTSTTVISVCRNELPFRWNGNNYTSTGNYNVTLTSSGNCDSIANLSFFVKDTGTSLTTISTCANRLPVNWNGSSYSAAGNYKVTLTGANGCDSVARLNLVVNPVATSLTRVSVCSNTLPYSWNGRNLTNGGTYRQVLTAASGCDSIATLVLTVKPVPQSQTYFTVCQAQMPFLWNGNTYNSGGNFSVTLTSAAGCDSIARLRLTVTNMLRDTLNKVACISELPFSWNGTDYSLPGFYSANFTTPAGCDSVATLALTIDSPSILPDSIEICPDELPYNYNGHIFTSGGSYPLSPPVFIDACHSVNLLNLVVKEIIPGNTQVTVCENFLPYVWNGRQFDSAGTYTISLTSSTGCDSLDVLQLTVMDTSSSITDTTVCSNQLPFLWNGVAYSASGEYRDTLIRNAACDSIVILRLNILQTTRDTTDVNICPLQLPYTWNGQTFTGGGIFTINLTAANGCDSVKVLDLRVSTVIQTTLDTTICGNNLPYLWNGQTLTSTGTYVDTLTNAAGCDSLVTLNLQVNTNLESTTIVTTCTSQLPFHWNGNDYTSSGTYSVTLINSAGCDSVARLDLTVSSQLSSETTITICNNQLPYTWNGNSYAIAGNYLVNLTSSTGCDSLAVLHLIVTDILTSTTNVTVCPAQLPYFWNGNSYTGEGTYAITLSTPNGCDSVPILSLTVAPVLTSLTEITVCESSLPFVWNGRNFTSPGAYTVNLTTTSGCDSVATLALAIQPTDTSETRLTICESALPFTWNGDQYLTSGIYPKTLQTSAGCDSVAILFLTVNSVDTSITTVTICRGDLPYRWNGQTLLDAGEFTHHQTGSAGCDSVALLLLYVNEPSSTTQQISICNLQLPYNWHGQTLTSAGTYVDTLINAAGCDSIIRMQLDVNPEVTTQLNISICSNELPYSWNGQVINMAGQYTANFVNQAGCDSIVRLSLTVNPVQNSTTSISVCRAALPYIWNGRTITAAGVYTANLSTINGCDSVSRLNFSIKEPTFSVTSAAICSADLPYSWNGSNYLVSGTYSDTIVNAAGCDSVLTLQLLVNPSPGAVNVPPPLTYCQFEEASPLLATADSGEVVQWYTSATGGQPAFEPPIPSTLLPGTFTFYVSAANQNCVGERTAITVTVNRKPDLGDDRTLAVCFGQTGNFAGMFDTSGLTTNWTFAGVPASPEDVAIPGTYSLIARNAEGCSDTANVSFAINPEVVANAGPDADVETNVPYRLQGSGNGNFSWWPPHLVNNPNIATPLTTVSSDATLVLTVTDNLGCVDADTVRLRVLNGPTFYVPSAFTPNGDGLNDIFRPTPVGIQKLDYFRVYNRYGELVYETSEIGKGWNGIYKGIQQNGGNYVWAVKGVDRTGRERLLKGNVILIR